MPFARDLLTEIQTAAAQSPILQNARLGTSAGVAIAHVKYPVRHLLTEAEELLKLAKRRVYEDRDNIRSALSFSVITDGSPRTESITPERWSRGGDGVLLSGRPYALEELDRFSARFRAVRGAALGKSQLYALLRHAHGGPAQLRSQILYQIGRRPEWQDLIQKLSGNQEGVLADAKACVRAVVPDYGVHEVLDLADMIELFDHWEEASERGEP